MYKTPFIPIIGTVLLLLLFSACSKPNFPYGTYLSENEFYLFKLNEDGSDIFAYAKSGSVIAEGTHSIKGNEITWETDSYCDEPRSKKASYTWTFEDGVLKFLVKGVDACSSRYKVLNNKSFYPAP